MADLIETTIIVKMHMDYIYYYSNIEKTWINTTHEELLRTAMLRTTKEKHGIRSHIENGPLQYQGSAMIWVHDSYWLITVTVRCCFSCHTRRAWRFIGSDYR